jgi:hypothetical protein
MTIGDGEIAGLQTKQCQANVPADYSIKVLSLGPGINGYCRRDCYCRAYCRRRATWRSRDTGVGESVVGVKGRSCSIERMNTMSS